MGAKGAAAAPPPSPKPAPSKGAPRVSHAQDEAPQGQKKRHFIKPALAYN